MNFYREFMDFPAMISRVRFWDQFSMKFNKNTLEESQLPNLKFSRRDWNGPRWTFGWSMMVD